jgi:hypothetical protein
MSIPVRRLAKMRVLDSLVTFTITHCDWMLLEGIL